MNFFSHPCSLPGAATILVATSSFFFFLDPFPPTSGRYCYGVLFHALSQCPLLPRTVVLLLHEQEISPWYFFLGPKCLDNFDTRSMSPIAANAVGILSVPLSLLSFRPFPSRPTFPYAPRSSEFSHLVILAPSPLRSCFVTAFPLLSLFQLTFPVPSPCLFQPSVYCENERYASHVMGVRAPTPGSMS